MRLLLVDGSNIVMRSAFGGQLEPHIATNTATNMIIRCARQFEATHLIVALDTPGVPTWRKDEYPEYKANRTQSTARWVHDAQESWTRKGWWIESVAGYEADDIIATVARRAATAGARVFVLSGDSDILTQRGMVDANGSGVGFIDVIKPVNGGKFLLLENEDVIEEYGFCEPNQLLDLKAMTGESGDNLPGAKGIGPGKAQRLLRDFGCLEIILSVGNQDKDAAKVLASEPDVRLTRRLAELVDQVPIVPIQPRECVFREE